MLGVNSKFDANGNFATDTTSHRASAITLDARNSGSIQFHTTEAGGNASERLRITSGGQVIVGGTSSQASDAVTLMPDGEVTAAGFYFSNNIGSAMNNTGIRRATTNTMVFDTDSTERVRITSDGRVNINDSTNTSYMLFVNGASTNTSALKIQSNNFQKINRL